MPRTAPARTGRNNTFEEDVVEVILDIPSGDVTTYGDIASEAGYPGAARAVGNVLRSVPGLPWWRVITTDGRLVPGMELEHTQRLRSEGISVRNGRVVPGRKS